MQERSELFEMTGSVETIIFRNEKNGYTILEIDNGQEIVTAVGTECHGSVWVRRCTL